VNRDRRVEDLVRELAPRVLATLVRRYGRFDACEDAVQEALLAAATQWPADGMPGNPHGWLLTVATRRLIEGLRSDQARRRREDAVAALAAPDAFLAPGPGDQDLPQADDTLRLLFLCCHPALSPASQVALTLRAVGGLTTAEIAHAFLVPEATMAQRISRAKGAIKASGTRFELPPQEGRAARLSVVLHVLYLVFNEGYSATSGPHLLRPELSTEAIRLARVLQHALPNDGEVAGLLALMLLTDARRSARNGSDGNLVPLAEQDRARWNRAQIAEGVSLLTNALHRDRLGAYQLQAAIAAVHDEAASTETTDWREILALYELLERLGPSPVVTLNRVVAVAMVRGPQAGLALIATLAADGGLRESHRLEAVRAHLLEMTGDATAALAAYERAATLTTSLPERRYLQKRAARLSDDRG